MRKAAVRIMLVATALMASAALVQAQYIPLEKVPERMPRSAVRLTAASASEAKGAKVLVLGFITGEVSTINLASVTVSIVELPNLDGTYAHIKGTDVRQAEANPGT